MALFGGMFGGADKHPNLDRLSIAVLNSLGVQLSPPTDDVLPIVDALTSHDLIGFENAHSVEGMQELFKVKSLRAMVDNESQTLMLSVAPPEEIESELKAEHSAVDVLHVGGRHQGTSRIIRSFGAASESGNEPSAAPPLLASATVQHTESIPVPPAFEHLEAVERLCPVLVDLCVKYGQLVSADKDVLKKIKPTDYTLEGRMTALERWKTELTRRSRGIHVRQAGPTSLLSSSDANEQASEEAVLRRFDTFLHWVGRFIKALEHRGIKFHGKPVWLPQN